MISPKFVPMPLHLVHLNVLLVFRADLQWAPRKFRPTSHFACFCMFVTYWHRVLSSRFVKYVCSGTPYFVNLQAFWPYTSSSTIFSSYRFCYHGNSYTTKVTDFPIKLACFVRDLFTIQCCHNAHVVHNMPFYFPWASHITTDVLPSSRCPLIDVFVSQHLKILHYHRQYLYDQRINHTHIS